MPVKCPHCGLINKCQACGKIIKEVGRTNPRTRKAWCMSCFKIIFAEEKKIAEEKRKKEATSDGIKIGTCVNRDYTEKIYRNAFQGRPKQLTKAIEGHRRNVAKNKKGMVKMTKQEQDYVTKTTEHL